jgi:dipeptidyl aminopeptidase/acylaminoacyl peptidase
MVGITVDVNEAVDAVYQLGECGLIDPKRACIRGVSAGGFTFLATLSTKPEVFAAGTSFYGLSDLVALHHSMPKFQIH